MEKIRQVQIIANGAIHRAEGKFPTLAKEVKAHDKYSNSSWYSLLGKAYEEYLEFIK